MIEGGRGEVLLLCTCLVLSVLHCGCTSYGGPAQPHPGSTGYSDCGTVQKARVLDIVDGDTIHVSFPDGSREKVRFLGIDTPEIHPEDNEPGEYAPLSDARCLAAWATAAKKYLSLRLKEKEVVLVSDCSEGERDNYGRYLAYVTLPDGTDLNAEMVKNGFARAYTRTKASRVNQYIALEKEARAHKTGIWDQAGTPCTYPPATLTP